MQRARLRASIVQPLYTDTTRLLRPRSRARAQRSRKRTGEKTAEAGTCTEAACNRVCGNSDSTSTRYTTALCANRVARAGRSAASPHGLRRHSSRFDPPHSQPRVATVLARLLLARHLAPPRHLWCSMPHEEHVRMPSCSAAAGLRGERGAGGCVQLRLASCGCSVTAAGLQPVPGDPWALRQATRHGKPPEKGSECRGSPRPGQSRSPASTLTSGTTPRAPPQASLTLQP